MSFDAVSGTTATNSPGPQPTLPTFAMSPSNAPPTEPDFTAIANTTSDHFTDNDLFQKLPSIA